MTKSGLPFPMWDAAGTKAAHNADRIITSAHAARVSSADPCRHRSKARVWTETNLLRLSDRHFPTKRTEQPDRLQRKGKKRVGGHNPPRPTKKSRQGSVWHTSLLKFALPKPLQSGSDTQSKTLFLGPSRPPSSEKSLPSPTHPRILESNPQPSCIFPLHSSFLFPFENLHFGFYERIAGDTLPLDNSFLLRRARHHRGTRARESTLISSPRVLSQVYRLHFSPTTLI